jgi:small-conductance mechanosensitive channel
MAVALTLALETGDVSSIVDPGELTVWDIGAAVVVLIVGYLLARWGRRASSRAVGRIDEMPDTIAGLAGSIVFWLVISLALVFALSILGFDTAPVMLVLLFVAVVIVLSGRSLLENFGASLILQVRAPFEPGDQIETGEHRGEVTEINGRTVVVSTMDGKQVHIPNSTVVANPIVNLTRRGLRRSRLDVGVAYGTDLGRAQQVLRTAVTDVEGVLDDPEPEVYVTEFDDSAISFAVRYWHQPQIRDGYVVTDVVARAINDALDAAAIVVAFPQATLWWGDGETAGPKSTPS